VVDALHKPLPVDAEMPNMPLEMPEGAKSAHPFKGGSKTGIQRIRHLIESGSMTSYKDTRNGLIGQDFSTKLSAWLALGSITARQVHWQMVDFEDGKTPLGKTTQGYGKGENKGTAAVRFELLWRDYMRLCTKKFGMRLFMIDGYRRDGEANFKFISSPFSHSTAKKNSYGTNDDDTRVAVERFIAGRTGTGLIDASQRELFLTGYTSNRTRQNVASYLSKHLGIDWRLGAEWYESNLIDYDVHNNWGNWQYVAGVGNDPRGAARVFNPVKQAVDYDHNGDYVRMWLPELRGVGKKEEGGVSLNEKPDNQQDSSLETLMGVFQPWRLSDGEKERLGVKGVEWVEKPLIKINFSVNRRGGGGKQSGGGGGGRGGRGGRGGKSRGQRGGREAKTGMLEKVGS
jgi:deoxyribodipyrimidine photo-lyase